MTDLGSIKHKLLTGLNFNDINGLKVQHGNSSGHRPKEFGNHP